MRVISGTAKGFSLESVDKDNLRPMLDRVKESLFNLIRGEIKGGRVLDLFCGTGALGIEALSRGAESCVFVEMDQSLATLTEENLEHCRLSEKAVLLRDDFFYLASRPMPAEGLPATLVFLDPPYALIEDPNQRTDLFETLEELCDGWIAPGALLMLHHAPLARALWPTERLRHLEMRVYGNSQLTFFEVPAEEDGETESE